MLRRYNRKKCEARKKYRRSVSRRAGEKYRKEFHIGNMGGIFLGDEGLFVKLLNLVNQNSSKINDARSFPKSKNRFVIFVRFRNSAY